MMVAPGCRRPAWCVCKGRRPPLFLGVLAGVGPGSGHLCPWQGSSRGLGPLASRCSSHLPRPARGALAMGARGMPGPRVCSCGRSRPRRSQGAPAAAPSAPSSPRPSFPPSLPSAIAGGVGGDFAGVSISYLAAKLSFCVSPSCSLQLLLSSEMPGQGKGLAPRGTWGPDELGVLGLEARGAPRRGGGSARVVPSSSLCLCKASGPGAGSGQGEGEGWGAGRGDEGDGVGSRREVAAAAAGGGWRGPSSERGAFEGISPSFQRGYSEEGEGDVVQLACGPHGALVARVCAAWKTRDGATATGPRGRRGQVGEVGLRWRRSPRSGSRWA